ncbi:MAG: hypothetical protein JRG89_04655 [Deltaproteobacteria bacterium]|nr:hypothetical protein [Deltaproteobacteria bacterium]
MPTHPTDILAEALEVDNLDVREFLGSPRHGYFFRVNDGARNKIEQRLAELRARGVMKGKTPIVNIQEGPAIVEMHDGNASAVAWLLYAKERGIDLTLGRFKESFDEVIVLRSRMHSDGEIWHPYVPPEVRCADRLQSVPDPEQHGREVRKALTRDGAVVFFDNTEFFSGEDACETIGAMARDYHSSSR